MRKYGISKEKYRDLWNEIVAIKERDIHYRVVDRWLSIFHGMTALGDTADESGFYPFAMRDETKAVWFIMRYL